MSEEKAIKNQLDQAQQRYEVGLSAITGVQEAQLAYDLSKASRINAEGSLFSAREETTRLHFWTGYLRSQRQIVFFKIVE